MKENTPRIKIPSEPFAVCISNSVHLGKEHKSLNKKLKTE